MILHTEQVVTKLVNLTIQPQAGDTKRHTHCYVENFPFPYSRVSSETSCMENPGVGSGAAVAGWMDSYGR